jgi:hypothetical protein
MLDIKGHKTILILLSITMNLHLFVAIYFRGLYKMPEKYMLDIKGH